MLSLFQRDALDEIWNLIGSVLNWLQSETLISIFFLQSFFFLNKSHVSKIPLLFYLMFHRENNKDLLQVPWLDKHHVWKKYKENMIYRDFSQSMSVSEGFPTYISIAHNLSLSSSHRHDTSEQLLERR